MLNGEIGTGLLRKVAENFIQCGLAEAVIIQQAALAGGEKVAVKMGKSEVRKERLRMVYRNTWRSFSNMPKSRERGSMAAVGNWKFRYELWDSRSIKAGMRCMIRARTCATCDTAAHLSVME